MSARPAALLLALLACGCGSGPRPGPRPALTALLARLAAGDVGAVCAALTPNAVAELAVDFRGRTCSQTLSTAARYVALRQGERAAVAAATVLPTLDVPLSPPPYRAGDTVARLRIAFEDPVLAQSQTFDVTLRLAGGAWKVSGGLSALFTLLG
jgi:hypothetical protein